VKLLVIGGGAGGPAAATRARRLDEDAEIIMLERGENVSYAHCGLPYYIGGVIESRDEMLMATPELLKQRYNIEVRIRSEVKAINPETKEIEIVNLADGTRYYEQYDKLILAPGAEPVRLPVSGAGAENIFTLRNLTDGDRILDFIREQKPKRAVVVGAGYIGLEMVENLRLLGMEVAVVEMLDQVLAPLDSEMASIVHKELLSNGVKVVLSDPLKSVESGSKGTVVRLSSGSEIPCDMVLMAVGVRPNIELAKSAGLEIGRLGGIKVNGCSQTSDPDIYAVGDAVESTHMVTGESVLMPLANIASSQARIAVDNIYSRQVSYRNSLGTSMVKVFNIAAATTGVNEKRLKGLGVSYRKSYLHPFSHAKYYPGACTMATKLLFSPDDGRIFGAQVVGSDGVDKRIDVFATAIMTGLTVYDLPHLQLAYVPQFGSAKDAVNMAGYVSANILCGDAPTVYWDESEVLESDGVLLLDVRTKEEVDEVGIVPKAKHIPLDELRTRLEELPRDKTIYLYCSAGLRSYVATRLLQQRGFDVRNVSGGFLSYQSEETPEN